MLQPHQNPSAQGYGKSLKMLKAFENQNVDAIHRSIAMGSFLFWQILVKKVNSAYLVEHSAFGSN